MLFILISFFVPILLALVLPPLTLRLGGKINSGRIYLYAACAVFFLSWYVPSPLIDGEDTAFMTHLLGGGVFSGLLWIYIRSAFKLHMRPWQDVIAVFALVSSLGVINELFELFVVRLGIAQLGLNDTNWDLLANTIGAMSAIGVWLMYKTYREVLRS